VEKGKYAGFGYFDSSDSVSSTDDLRNLVRRMEWYPDSNDLIRGWMKKNKYKLYPFSSEM
jgi:hypothetical protein